MPSEIEQTIKNVAEKIGKYIQDAATLTVQTDYLNTEGAADFAQSKAAALTVIKLDGDCKTVVPVRQRDDGPAEIESGIFGLHQQNVTTAIEYRSRILHALLEVIKQIRI
ncbi:MAG TPA: hypothetical protein VIX17_23550 [Pyrinomonadaceae bacterium]|jgi:hypothetical protein